MCLLLVSSSNRIALFFVQVPEGHVYLAGDNLPWSRDSRNFGPVPLGLVNGKITAVVWPPRRMRWLENPLQPAKLPDDSAARA